MGMDDEDALDVTNCAERKKLNYTLNTVTWTATMPRLLVLMIYYMRTVPTKKFPLPPSLPSLSYD